MLEFKRKESLQSALFPGVVTQILLMGTLSFFSLQGGGYLQMVSVFAALGGGALIAFSLQIYKRAIHKIYQLHVNLLRIEAMTAAGLPR